MKDFIELFKDIIRDIMGIFRRSGNPKPSNPPIKGDYRGDHDGETPAPPPVSVDPPENTSAPSIAGDTAVGSTLTATPGVWTGSPNITGVWQADGTPITGAVNLTFVIRAADEGKDITYKETALNVGGTATATSNAITATAASTPFPSINSNPTISYTGTLTIDTVLTGVSGDYDDETSITRQWLRDNTAISGQTGSTYTVTSTDIGADIVYRELVTNSNGTIVADSDAVVPIQPPTSSTLLQTFTMEDQPSTVSITRAGTGATYRNADGTIVEAAANTARYHYDTDGSFLGLYVERSKTNQTTGSKSVGDSNWTAGTGVTVSLNAAEAPNGLTEATRIQVDAGTSLRGIVRGQTVTSGGLRNSCYFRNRSGTTTLTMRHPSNGYTTITVGTTWTRFDQIGPNEGGSHFNINILCPDTDARDFEVWGVDICPGGTTNDSLLLSGSSAVTRPNEVLNIQTAHTGTKDVKVTFSDGDVQHIRDQTLSSGVLSINATSLVKNLVTTVELWNQGTLPSLPPTSEPPPPPPPTSPPPSGSVWSSAEVETAIALAISENEAAIKGVSSSAGWANRASLAMGNRWNSAPPMPAGWDWPTGPWDVNMYWPYIYPWGIIFNRHDNATANGWVELKEFEMQILYRNASSWTRVIGKTNEFGWGELFMPDNVTSTGISITKRVNASGTTSIKVPTTTNHPHFTCAGSGTRISNLENIEGVLVTCLVRIDPTGDTNLKALFQMSADPKPTTGGNSADGVPWYPGTQCSAASNVTADWRRMVSCNITGIAADSTQLSRTFPASRIRAVRPLA